MKTPTWDSISFLTSLKYAKNTCNELEECHLFQQVFSSTVEVVNYGAYHFSRFDVDLKYDNDEKKLSDCFVRLNKHLSPVSNGRLYDSKIDVPPPQHFCSTRMGVVNEDCVSVAIMVYNNQPYKNKKIAILNCASAKNPGGSVTRGKCGQEEYLVLVSDYYRHLFRYSPDPDYSERYQLKPASSMYPLDMEYGGVYSPDVAFLRGTQNEGFPFLPQVYQFNVIAVPAINYHDFDTTNEMHSKGSMLEKILIQKIRTIFNIAILNGVNSLILTAWGCGGFSCPPDMVAQLFYDILLKEYSGYFKDVVFAIDLNRSFKNYHSFYSLFGPYYLDLSDNDMHI